MLIAPKIKIWNRGMFVFMVLFSFSCFYYATADETVSDKNFFQDTDQDGLSNDEEKVYGTDPDVADTDGDSYTDGIEIESGYDPLKPAPGDRVVQDANNPMAAVEGVTDEPVLNITERTSQELVEIVKTATTSGNPDEVVTADAIQEALQNALSESNQEIVLPEIDVKEIKVKEIPKKLKGDERDEREQKDVLEYLTTLQYLLINNSPTPIEDEDDVERTAQSVSTQAIAALNSGSFGYLDDLEEKGTKFLDQIKEVEVPETMVSTHVNALQLALYASALKNELKDTQMDPLGQVATYGKIQALLGEVQNLADSTQSSLEKFGLENIGVGF
jgi:hypothetical protein